MNHQRCVVWLDWLGSRWSRFVMFYFPSQFGGNSQLRHLHVRGRFNYPFHPGCASAIALPKQSHTALKAILLSFPRKFYINRKTPKGTRVDSQNKTTKSPNWQIIWNWFASHQLLSVAISGVTGNPKWPGLPWRSQGRQGGQEVAPAKRHRLGQLHLKSQRRNEENMGQTLLERPIFFGGTAGTGDSRVYGVAVCFWIKMRMEGL